MRLLEIRIRTRVQAQQFIASGGRGGWLLNHLRAILVLVEIVEAVLAQREGWCCDCGAGHTRRCDAVSDALAKLEAL